MNTLSSRANWNAVVSKLKQQFVHLTDDDLHLEKDKEDEWSERLQKKLGKSMTEISRLIAKL